jgi:hypothetical protein
MSIETQMEREEAAIWEAVERGELTNKEAWKQQLELQRDYAQAARESAQEEYDRELERW